MKRHAQQDNIDHEIARLDKKIAENKLWYNRYLDYKNNYLTLDTFCERLGIDHDIAMTKFSRYWNE